VNPLRAVAAHLPVWRLAYASLSELAKPSDAFETANNYLEKFQTEYSKPQQTAAELKPTKSQLKQTLLDIKKRSLTEVE
jgi:uncharacterized protein HemY